MKRKLDKCTMFLPVIENRLVACSNSAKTRSHSTFRSIIDIRALCFMYKEHIQFQFEHWQCEKIMVRRKVVAQFDALAQFA